MLAPSPARPVEPLRAGARRLNVSASAITTTKLGGSRMLGTASRTRFLFSSALLSTIGLVGCEQGGSQAPSTSAPAASTTPAAGGGAAARASGERWSHQD